jgi:4-alpha-glucanotransferase
MPETEPPGLSALARLYGVQTAFHDVDGRRRRASPPGLVSVLKALGAPLESISDIPGAVQARRQELWHRGVEPVTVAWLGQPTSLTLWLPASESPGAVRAHLTTEEGAHRRWTYGAGELTPTGTADIEGAPYRALEPMLPADLPVGYHNLILEAGGSRWETLVIVAPPKAFQGDEGRSWGLFAPAYALRSDRDWGAGDLTDMESLARWASDVGGRVLATLPLLAAYLNERLEPSPYAPASRLFWNEFYVDVTRISELEDCPAARTVLGSREFQREVEHLRSHSLVDYRGVMAIKRRVLEELARCLLTKRSRRYEEFASFVEGQAEVDRYARFRAVSERRPEPWPGWPLALREGEILPGEYDEEAAQYHRYAQWVVQEQMEGLSRTARDRDLRLFLDLPLGAHPAGYDAWRAPGLFARDVYVGAPPDTFFKGGQNWGFQPPHPEAQRREGYRYFIDCLRHHLRHSDVLHIDHVMGLHRLYWIPPGLTADEGVYVRYPAEELYAILCLESHRHGALVVGEDLGTVPQYVRRAMGLHGFERSYVWQIEPTATPDRPFGSVPVSSVASLDTHDTPPFAAYWRTLDDESRQAMITFLRGRGLVGEAVPEEQAVLAGCLAFLSAGPARTVLVSLEDLWLEERSQNVPGTTDEHPNWRGKTRYTLDEVRSMPQVVNVLRAVDLLRRRRGGDVAPR